MLLQRLLMGARIFRAPETDEGQHEIEVEEPDVGGADEDLDDEVDSESADGGAEDRGADDDDGADGGADRPSEDNVRQPSRAQQRVETALREAREARAEAAQLRAEREAERGQGQTQAVQARRDAHLATLDPYERTQFLSEERAQQQDQRIARIEFNSMDAADQTDFAAKCARTPALAAVADQVETELKRIRGNGQNVDRETIAKYVLGDRALARAAGATTRQGKKGAAAIASQRGKPAAGRSDVRPDAGSTRGDTAEARRKRLENLSI